MTHCVFPNGDPGEPGFGFCGDLAVLDRPYCAHHCRIAYIGHHERKRVLSEIEMEVTMALRRMGGAPNLTANQLGAL